MNHAIHLLKKEQSKLKVLKPRNNKDWTETEHKINDIELVIRLYKVYLAQLEVRDLVNIPIRLK